MNNVTNQILFNQSLNYEIGEFKTSIEPLFTHLNCDEDGYYSEETGKLEKQIVEAEYAGNDSLAEELRNKYMEQLENDELASFYELG